MDVWQSVNKKSAKIACDGSALYRKEYAYSSSGV